jgi:hypothetical protein
MMESEDGQQLGLVKTLSSFGQRVSGNCDTSVQTIETVELTEVDEL